MTILIVGLIIFCLICYVISGVTLYFSEEGFRLKDMAFFVLAPIYIPYISIAAARFVISDIKLKSKWSK